MPLMRRAGAMPWCEHFEGIGVEWQWLEMCRKAVESSLIYMVERTSAQDDTKVKTQRSVAFDEETSDENFLHLREVKLGCIQRIQAS